MSDASDMVPPEDFRTLSVFPNAEELQDDHKPFLRKAIVSGRYENVDHYLDVFFRLLKEDYVSQLRKDIAEYLNIRNKDDVMTLSKTTFHHDVRFLYSTTNTEQVGVVLGFPTVSYMQNSSEPLDQGMNVDQRDKRFMNGSLLCFTKDNFRSVFFGRVLDGRKFYEGTIDVGFESDNAFYEFYNTYIMVECHFFFEPYYQTMKALQLKSESTFPLRKYLVEVAPDVEPPNYLKEGSGTLWIDDACVQALDEEWPEGFIRDLNSSQCRAFKAALTQKMAIIQGPPGTGKTHLGIKIAKTLLDRRNISIWRNNCSMLIVCCSNHALDQFLEALLSVDSSIIRLGDQSKSQKLVDKNMVHARKKLKLFYDQRLLLKSDLSELSADIAKMNSKLAEVTDSKNILRFSVFECIDHSLKNTWFVKAADVEMISWLFDKPEEVFMPPLQNFRDDNDSTKNVILSLNYLSMQIDNIKKPRRDYLGGLKWWLTIHLSRYSQLLEYLLDKLEAGYRFSPEAEIPDFSDPYGMNLDDRLKLYFHWLRKYREFLEEKKQKLTEDHQRTYDEYIQLRDMEDAMVVQGTVVAGMTTTDAARLQDLNNSLKPKIVIIDEAAEVLEPQLTVALTRYCEHLILLGDHQQLQPSVLNGCLKNKFNLGISMCQRMVVNNMKCHALDV